MAAHTSSSAPTKPPNGPLRRVTMRDVARRAGVSAMTVCLALRERAGVSLETRDRVQQAAAELGYRPDPVLNALNAYKYSRRLTHYSGTLAFLDLRRGAGGRRYRYITSYLIGARRRAEALGYKVEEFPTQPAKLAAVARVLEHRGVPGVLLSPLAEAEGDLDFPWDKFSALTFGFSLRNPDLHRIALHHFEAMRRCLRELAALDYRRIGLCLLHEQDARVNGQYTGAFWSEQRARERAGHTLLTPLLLPVWDEAKFAAWLRRVRPDAIIGGPCPQILEACAAARRHIPEDLGIAQLWEASERADLARIHENNEFIGASAVDLLIGMIHCNDRGVPAKSMHHLVNPGWLPGTTLRRQN